MLPTYARVGNSGINGSAKLSFMRRALRTREKFLILLLFATLAFVCLGGIFYLPDNFVPTDKVREVYKKFQNAGPEIFIPAPPVARHKHGASDGDTEDDRHILNDRDRLNAKIQGELGAGLEKPAVRGNEAPVMKAPTVERAQPSSETASDGRWIIPTGEDTDPVTRDRRNKVKEVKHYNCPQQTLRSFSR